MIRSRLLVASSILVLVAACSSDGADGDAPAGPVSAEDGVVALTGTDSLRWDAEQVTAETGDLTFELTCEEAVNHNLVIDGGVVAECAPGETTTGTVQLESGEHRFVCNVPGHERTMQGTITVT